MTNTNTQTNIAQDATLLQQFEYVANELTNCKVFADDAKRLGNNLAQVAAAIMLDNKLADVIQLKKLTSKEGRFYKVASFARKGIEVGKYMLDNPSLALPVGKDKVIFNYDAIINAIEGKDKTAISSIYQAILNAKKPIEEEHTKEQKAFKIGCELMGVSESMANSLGHSYKQQVVNTGLAHIANNEKKENADRVKAINNQIAGLSSSEQLQVAEFLESLLLATNSKTSKVA